MVAAVETMPSALICGLLEKGLDRASSAAGCHIMLCQGHVVCQLAFVSPAVSRLNVLLLCRYHVGPCAAPLSTLPFPR